MPASKKKNSIPQQDRDARSRILERAVDLFYVQGVHATGINQIIREAEVAKDTLYRFFPSKDQLIQEALSIWGRKLGVLWERKLRNQEDAAGLFRSLSKLERDSLRKIPGYNGCPVATMMMEMGRMESEEMKKVAAAIETRWVGFLETEFGKFQRQGTLRSDLDANHLARQCLMIYQGALAMWRISGDAGYLNQMEEALLALID